MRIIKIMFNRLKYVSVASWGLIKPLFVLTVGFIYLPSVYKYTDEVILWYGKPVLFFEYVPIIYIVIVAIWTMEMGFKHIKGYAPTNRKGSEQK